jgi:hypothetical protein
MSTTTASVTRAADAIVMPYSKIEANQFNPNEGTFFVDIAVPLGTWYPFYGWVFGSGQSTDYIQIALALGTNGVGKFNITTQIHVVAGGVQQAVVQDVPPFTFETPVKIAARYSSSKLLGMCANGRTLLNSATIPPVMPAMPQNFTFGPVNSWSLFTTQFPILLRRWMYFPRFLSVDQMQQLTA